MRKSRLLTLTLLLYAFGCDSGKAKSGTGGTTGSGGATGSDGATGCAKLWTVRPAVSATSSALIAGGALVLHCSNNGSGEVLNVLQSSIVGDFDASFTFESFASGGAGTFLQAVVAEAIAAPTNPIATAGIGSLPIVGVSATFQPGMSDLQATTATAGAFRFQRTGTSMTVTTTPATGSPATVTNAGYGGFDLQIGLQIGSSNSMGTVGGMTDVRVTAFSLTGGGSTVVADTFDCNSLK